jgi:hypothetical protein
VQIVTVRAGWPGPAQAPAEVLLLLVVVVMVVVEGMGGLQHA